VVNRPPVKRFNRGPADGDAESCVVMSCRVAVPGGPRYAGPRWCSPGYYAIFTGASPVPSCYTVVALQSQTDSDTFVRANGIRRPAVSRLTVIDRRHVLSRHSQHDMPCRGNVKMPEFTEHKRSLLGAPACPSYDAHHDALLVRIAWAT
jgi:hypothetical protein